MDLSRLTTALDGNPALQRRARLASLCITVLIDDTASTVRIGDAVTVAAGGADDAAFSLSASTEGWREFAKPVPAVGYQSLVGMQRVVHLRVDGDMVVYGRHMLFLEQLFAALRPPAGTTDIAAIGTPFIEPVVGRYLRLDFNGAPHRLYFEEAGQGIPLLCLHTAGSDGRQYRALLNDPAITDRFRASRQRPTGLPRTSMSTR